jgi:hypothetical protein
MKMLLQKLLNKFCPLRTIIVADEEYLRRYYVVGDYPIKYWPVNTRIPARLPWLPFTVYIHRFMAPDRDRNLHNHPWQLAVSVILAGGYTEIRKQGAADEITRDVLPGTISVITDATFHMVSKLLGKETWTLFITGPRASSWGFLTSKGFVDWREWVGR